MLYFRISVTNIFSLKSFLPPFIFPQGGKVLSLPPWGKARKGVEMDKKKY